MAYLDKEISTQDGRPVALYLIEWGPTRWRYTSTDRPVTINEPVEGVMQQVTYEPRAISDNGMVQGGSSQNDFQINAPGNLPVVDLFRGTPPSETIWITVRRIHVGEVDAPIYWKGTLNNVKRPEPAQATLIGKPIAASLKRTGLRLCWTRECPHFLYDVDCTVDKSAFAIEAEVIALNGSMLYLVPTTYKDDGWFRGGFVEWQASFEGTLERRFIEQDVNVTETGDVTLQLTIFGIVDYLAVGDTVTLYPGCNRLPTTCNDKFNNIPNYGGFEKMPGKSPFGVNLF
jgi:uncharacterized phage protein (TIGR02218 family)